MKNYFVVFALCFLAGAKTFTQTQIHGKIIDQQGQPVFAANVYLQSKMTTGTVSDLDGKFTITLYSPNQADSLVCSSIGYQNAVIGLENLPKDSLIVILHSQSFGLSGVEVIGTSPISESFAVETINQLDVYLNPAANADPLKAIAASASSTNTDESANPNLRGSTADRSRVLIHGVPIYRPVRNSQINGIGFFSLFNTALLDKMQVYASNPPLLYGNSSAGLVELQFKKKVNTQNIQLSTGLASSGLLWVSPVNDKLSIRSFANYQYAKPFVKLNQNSISDLQDFQNLDAGVQWFAELNDHWQIQAFHYGIKEGVRANSQIYTFRDEAQASTLRNFNVVNSRYQNGNIIIDINHGSDFSRRAFVFGNLDSRSNRQNFFHSLNIRHYPSSSWNYQIGLSHDYNRFDFEDTYSQLYYAYSDNIPTIRAEDVVQLHQLEPYFYGSWNGKKNWVFSIGLRSNIPLNDQQYFLSYQGSIRHYFNREQSILLGFGKYHSYRYPNFAGSTFSLLDSRQLSIDYEWKKDKRILQSALFYKLEGGGGFSELFPDVHSARLFGAELSWQHFFKKYWNLELSNIFIRQQLQTETSTYRGDQSLNYFVRATLQFNHPRFLNAALFFQARPGRAFTSVVGANRNPTYGVYEPIYSGTLNDDQFSNYQRLDLSFSKEIKLPNSNIIAYLTLSNILNTENERSKLYNEDYTNAEVDTYMRRIIYFGTVWSW